MRWAEAAAEPTPRARFLCDTFEMSWLRRSLEKLTGALPPLTVDPLQEEARRRIEAVQLHGTHALLGEELAPRAVECAGFDVAAFVSTREYRSATTNVLIVPELADDAVLLAVFEGNYKHGPTALACSLVASALCNEMLAVSSGADLEAALRRAFESGSALLRALDPAGAPDEGWSEAVRAEVLGTRPGWRGLGTSVTAAVLVGNQVTLAHVGETEGHRLAADGIWTRLTASHLFVDDPRCADVEDKSLLDGALARIVMGHGRADPDIVRATLSPGDTLVLATSSVARRLGPLDTRAMSAAEQCLAWASAEPIPAAAVIARAAF